MSEKNIDQLYREKLKDFEQTPDESVWKAVEASLDQKKKSRRVIPLWWKLGGIAALLAILITLFNPFATEDIDTPIISDIETENPMRQEQNGGDLEKEQIVQPTESELSATKESELKNDDGKEDLGPKESSLAVDDNANNQIQGNGETSRMPSSNLDMEKDKTEQAVASVPKKENEKGKDPLLNAKENKNSPLSAEQESKEVIANNEKSNSKKIGDDLLPSVGENSDPKEAIRADNMEETIADVDSNEEESDKSKKSIFEEIEEQKEAVAASDKSKRWSVGPSIAPVYFSSLGDGSPIHSNFVPNSKSGNINLSYGVSVAYEVSKKLSIRSGLHKVDYGYDTNEVSFTSSLTASTSTQLANIDYNSTSKNLVVQSSQAPQEADIQSFNTLEVSAQDPSRQGRMVQEFGYVEVPLELNYALVDQKIGVNLIGGLSSLFLVNNSVSLESEGATTEMGEANNINSVNFSTNIGLGLNYKMSPKVQLNLEPMFKYQLNTFSDAAGNFQPFSIGVYSGLSYKF